METITPVCSLCKRTIETTDTDINCTCSMNSEDGQVVFFMTPGLKKEIERKEQVLLGFFFLFVAFIIGIIVGKIL